MLIVDAEAVIHPAGLEDMGLMHGDPPLMPGVDPPAHHASVLTVLSRLKGGLSRDVLGIGWSKVAMLMMSL